MCKISISLGNLRKAIYAASKARLDVVAGKLGIRDVLTTNLRTHTETKAAVVAGRHERLAVALAEATHFAERADLFEAMDALTARRRELERLQADVRRFHAAAVPVVDVQVLPEDFGRKGRGAKIRAAIVAGGLTWQQVAAEFVLAESTARRYVREANRPSKPARRAFKLRIAA